MSKLIVGKEYEADHNRKGKFTFRFLKQDEDFTRGILTSTLVYDRMGPVAKGEEFSFRTKFATIKEV